MVFTRRSGSTSNSQEAASNLNLNASLSNKHCGVVETKHVALTRRQKILSKLETSDVSVHDGLDKEEFVNTRRSLTKVQISKNSLNQPSFEQSHRYQHALRHSSVDNGVMIKKKIDGSSHTRSLRSLGLEEEVSSCEEEDGIGALASSCRPRSTSRETFPNMLLRRSSRQKKTVYSTLNVSTLEHAVMLNDELEEQSPRPRKKGHSIKPELRDLLLAQGKDPDSVEALSQPDIYNSIKSRKRQRRPRRFFDEMMDAPDHHLDPEPDEEEEEEEEQKEEDNDDNPPEEHDDEIEQDTGRKYSLRTKRAQPLRLVYEIQRQTRQPRGLFDHLASSPAHRRRNKLRDANPASPYQRRRRKTNSQGASSTSSSDSDSDERKFQNRKKKSMTKARNRCLPMNLTSSELATHGFAKERRKIGSSLADVDPMNIDKTVKFDSIGGHKKHIRALKEMIVFPLLYPEVFQKFHINPPRGCLFYGPPGNGKTLVARALANECSSEGRKVAFFMRKGADCLSKWVGESERQLRLLFDQAYQMRPSIIFFDEIDGLAPVRSSRQDQIHSSIVSTLLGLMDGLDNRGEIIVIGATNRIDSIDPALRRPGRFDREFAFPPPDKETRREIFKIHTQKWSPPLSDAFLEDLAGKTTGYCGADIMILCAESALFALRRRYPQIYSTDEKLQLDVNTISIHAADFYKAMKKIVPSAQRLHASPRYALNPIIRPLLTRTLNEVMKQLGDIFPILQKKSKLLKSLSSPSSQSFQSSDESDDYDDDNLQTMLPLPLNGLSVPDSYLFDLSMHTYRESEVCRPRLLIRGSPGDGHITHLTPAILYDLEGLPVHLLDVPNMNGYDVRSPEEACAQVFREARRTAPSIIYIPYARRWWRLLPHTVRHTFKSLAESLPVGSKVLILATTDYLHDDNSDDESDDDITKFFSDDRREIFHLDHYYPSTEERLIFFAPIFLHLAKKPPVDKRLRKSEVLEVLPKAAPPQMATLTQQELEKIEHAEESTMRSLRLFLRDVLTRLAQDRRFKVFLKPVDTDEVPDYTEVIAQPMDISTMMNKIDQHQYHNVAQFVTDINLICSNALEYNPDRSAEDRAIRHRACLLKDIAHAIIEDDLDLDFEKLCNDIIEARRRRKADPLKFAPKYYKVLPKPILSPDNPSQYSETSEQPATKKQVRTISTPSRKRRRRSAWASGRIKKPAKKPKMKQNDEENSQDEDHDDDDNEADVKTETEAESQNDVHAKIVSDDDDVIDKSGNENDRSNNSENSLLAQGCDESPNTQSDLFENNPTQTNESCDASPVPHSQINGIENGGKDPLTGTLQIKDDANLSQTATEDDEITLTNQITESPGERSADKSDQSTSDFHDVLESEPRLLIEDDCESSIVEDKQINSPPPADVSVGESLSPRMTLRSRAKTHQEQDPSNDVIIPPPPPLIVEEKKLNELLHRTVSITDHMKVESLEEVYSALVRCVRKHRHSYDKTILTQELEDLILSMSKK